MEQAAHNLKYNQKVFVTPPWEEIYCNDSERKQTFDEAALTYNHIVEAYAYSKYGYELIEIPKTDVKNRVEFILQHVNK